MNVHYRLFNIFFLIVAAGFIGCAQANLTVLAPAEINTKDIKTVAVGNFEIGGIQGKFISERKGRWKTYQVELSEEEKRALSRAVRARVVNLLTTTPYFKVVFTDEFAALENDAALQQLISVQGYKDQNVDAVINGKIWIEIERTDGAELSKVDLNYIAPAPSRQGQMDVTVEQVAWWPYKSARGSLALEIKMTRLNPTEVIAVTFDSRAYSNKVGGPPVGLAGQVTQGLSSVSNLMADRSKTKKDEQKKEIESSDLVLPSFEQLVAETALSIAASFVKRVAVTEQRVAYPIAAGGDASAKVLIESGAYGVAIDRLQKATAGDKKEPADLYNLGLCFEAIGEYDLALTLYREAFDKDRGSLTYASGIGRIERIQREYPAIRRQLKQKQS
ncbi:hypothetical protein WDW89_03080 [Deltaproteobacteria bacterium TL4]